jgi:flagellar basal body rod protein FlgB
MLKSLFGPDSVTHMLRGGLEEVSATHRTIAARVSQALESSTSEDFAGQLDAQGKVQASEADLQQDMTALADNELRYEADAKLLQAAYAQLRAAIHNNG